jgi:formylglycine-generating enzyme required for sulfatase activity
MPTHFDLVISLYRRDATSASTSAGDSNRASYGVDLRFTTADSEKEKIASGTTSLFTDDPAFRELSLDPAAYGAYLAGQLLAEPALASFFDGVRVASQSGDGTLHIRLHIRSDAAELHNLRWETLRLPGGASTYAVTLTGENLTFSRYLDSRDWRPVRPRSAADIRALIVVADPSDAARFGLAPVKSDQELAAARASLGEITTADLATRGQVTLNNITARFRDGCDILCLVAHGMLADGEPRLFLEKEDGTGTWIAGSEFTTRIQELDDRPRLAVLVSCQSAGAGESEPTTQDSGALVGLGPRLAEAGIPAVIAMQGNFTMKTAATFMPVLFRELRRDGLADRAMAVARGTVRDRPDWWMPVLFTCLKSGQVWEPAGPDTRPAIPRQPFEPETIYVPAGEFQMGADPGEGIPEYETPRHPLTLPAYRIGKYPVTNREYAEFIRREKTQDVPKDAGWFLREPPAGRLDHPVTGVSWDDAGAYCQWLSRESGRRYRLPSEAEWEKAARGPSTGSVPGRRYPWGGEWDETCANAGSTGTTPVTSHPAGASPYGCEDLLGNVQQWTATLWGTQPGQPGQRYGDRPDGGPAITEPADLPAQARLVHRGGSYRSQPADLRCTARGNATPDSRVAWRGFRVAMEIDVRG